MSTEFYIGTIVTVFFGIISYLQSRRGPATTLIFVIEDVINLYADITRNIAGIEVKYKGEEVTENLYLVKAYLFCFGNKDIVKEQISKNLFIEFNNNSTWKDCKLVDKTSDLDVSLKTEENRITFHFDLLKNEDFLCIQALYETKEIKEKKTTVGKLFVIEPPANKTFNVNHRIANVGKVETLTSKVDIVPLYAPILGWVLVIVTAYFMVIQPSKIENYHDVDFKKLYTYTNQAANRDTIIKNLKKKISLSNKNIEKMTADRYTYFSKTLYYLRYETKNDRLYKVFDDRYKNTGKFIEEAEKDIEIMKNRLYVMDNVYQPSDSTFKEVQRNYTWAFFFLNEVTPKFKADQYTLISYELKEKSNLYFLGFGLGIVIVIFLITSAFTGNYLKNRNILKKIDLVTRNSKS